MIFIHYAKSKGDYQSRYDSVVSRYSEGTDYEAELTADLIGEYLFTDADFVNHLSTSNRNLFQKIYDEIKYLCKIATAGSKEARQLEKVKKAFEEAYRTDSTKSERNTQRTIDYSLRIKHTDGTETEISDARDLTKEQAIEYLKQAKSGVLRRDTYIPVRKDTPQVIIETLSQVNEKITNQSLIMQVRKAQQAMSAKDRRNQGKKAGNNVRPHSLSPEAIVDIVNRLDNPSMIVYQTNRHDQNGNDLPNNVAVFVEYAANGNESVAVIEFESSIDSEFIGTEFGDTNYHTVVTVFEPDIERNGISFDYAEELLSNPNNIELTIEKRHSARSATGEKHPNTSSNMPSNNSIPQNAQNVNNKKSLSFKDSEISAKHSGYNVYGEDVKLEGISDDTAEGAANDSSANLDQENFSEHTAPMTAEDAASMQHDILNSLDDSDAPIESTEPKTIKTVRERLEAKLKTYRKNAETVGPGVLYYSPKILLTLGNIRSKSATRE